MGNLRSVCDKSVTNIVSLASIILHRSTLSSFFLTHLSISLTFFVSPIHSLPNTLIFTLSPLSLSHCISNYFSLFHLFSLLCLPFSLLKLLSFLLLTLIPFQNCYSFFLKLTRFPFSLSFMLCISNYFSLSRSLIHICFLLCLAFPFSTTLTLFSHTMFIPHSNTHLPTLTLTFSCLSFLPFIKSKTESANFENLWNIFDIYQIT